MRLTPVFWIRGLRSMVRHSGRSRIFKWKKWKSFINTAFFPTLTLYAFHTNKKQYLDTLHKQKKEEMYIRMQWLWYTPQKCPLYGQTTNRKNPQKWPKNKKLSVQGEFGVRICISALFSSKLATLFGYPSPDFTWAIQVHESEMWTHQGRHRVQFFRETKSKTDKLREKGRDLTQSYDKSPYTPRKIPKATWQQKNAIKNFDYTTIADRLRTVSGSNSSHPTGVVKPVYERSTFPLTATAVLSKGLTLKKI